MTTRTKLNEEDTERIRNNRMDEWAHFRNFGYHFDAMPKILGITPQEWAKTYDNARKCGDPRAVGRPQLVQGGQEFGPITRYGSGMRRGRVLMPNSRS